MYSSVGNSSTSPTPPASIIRTSWSGVPLSARFSANTTRRDEYNWGCVLRTERRQIGAKVDGDVDSLTRETEQRLVHKRRQALESGLMSHLDSEISEESR